MSLTDVLKTPLRRLIPHEGLVIDVNTWDDAHQYHVANQRLHAMTMHNSGVVAGLEVVAWDPPDNSVVINPGIAVDSTGRTIVVGEPQRFPLQTDEAGTHYLVLQYREVPADSGDASENGDSQPHHVLEERSEAPDESYVELARVQISGNNNVVSEPADPYNPGPDEIDARDRNVSGPRSIGEINVGVIPLEIDSDGNVLHASGTMSLIRAINVTTGYLATFRGSINLNQEITDCDLLVMAGRQEFTLADDWALVLGKFMERGGVLLVESCGVEAEATGESTPFQQSAIQMAEQLGLEFSTAERGHPLFTAHHLFAQAPDGIDGPALVVDSGGIIYSNGDFGCLWDGGRPDQPAKREAIRSAMEFGTNIGVHASKRVDAQSVRLVAQ